MVTTGPHGSRVDPDLNFTLCFFMGGLCSNAFAQTVPHRFVNYDAEKHMAFITEASQNDSVLLPAFSSNRLKSALGKQGMVALNKSGQVIAILLFTVSQERREQWQCEL